MDRSRIRTPLLIVLAMVAIVAVLMALRGLDGSEPENTYGAVQPGTDITADASAAPLEGAEGAAGLVSPAPTEGSPQ